MGNDVAKPFNTVAKSTVHAANTTVYATKSAVNKTVDYVTDPRVGKALKDTGKGIARTGSSAIQGAGYAVAGTAMTAAGAAVAIGGNDKLLKQGIGTLNNAKDKLLDAIVGRAKATASTTANISRPYNITFTPVDVDAKVLEGAIGMTVIQPTLLILKPTLRKIARRETESQLQTVVKTVRKQLTEIKFNDDPFINTMMQTAWEPENLYAKFLEKDRLCVSLQSGVVKSLLDQIGISVKLSFMSPVTVLQQKLNCYIEVDTGNSLFCVTIFGMDDILEMIKCKVLMGVIEAIGDACYDCSVKIDPSNENISIGVDAFIKVPL